MNCELSGVARLDFVTKAATFEPGFFETANRAESKAAWEYCDRKNRESTATGFAWYVIPYSVASLRACAEARGCRIAG